MYSVTRHPDPFLEVRVSIHTVTPSLDAACAGYESGAWRCEQLVKHVLEWLPEFALKYSEWSDLHANNALPLLAKAALAVYTSPKYKKRGELGELILHILLRQHFHSLPAISKYFYKDAGNDTVKGFDAVHVVVNPSGKWELWLGEVKFYKDITSAINDAIKELEKHSANEYLRSEFSAIMNKIDDEWPDASKLRDLISRNKTLDKIFENICIPVLLTYDSDAINSHTVVSEQFKAAFKKEVEENYSKFSQKKLPKNLNIRLLLFPMGKKDNLTAVMDSQLKALQGMANS